jgi:hypothetical protein
MPRRRQFQDGQLRFVAFYFDPLKDKTAQGGDHETGNAYDLLYKGVWNANFDCKTKSFVFAELFFHFGVHGPADGLCRPKNPGILMAQQCGAAQSPSLLAQPDVCPGDGL